MENCILEKSSAFIEQWYHEKIFKGPKSRNFACVASSKNKNKNGPYKKKIQGISYFFDSRDQLYRLLILQLLKNYGQSIYMCGADYIDFISDYSSWWSLNHWFTNSFNLSASL